ncbi:MAG TPA: ChbG/HpnK family deacetylase [Acidobacteriaceae bacterium]|jgi:hopanoid biosynthesis associated protein HpnK|nr:ChbG/HpnK family deacetylase [Acidobacteriaceae bacterium]
MPARLIINADDFGLTRGINRAVGELHSAGVLTSATLMAGGPAFDDAVEVVRAHPTLGVGCHIVLTDGVPVSPPESIPTLMAHDRRTFRLRLTRFLEALITRRISSEDIAREALAQIEKLRRAGIRVTHLDTHKHTHLFPMVYRPLLEVAERTGIPAIRSPFEPAWSQSLAQGHTARRLAIRALTLLKPSFDSAPQLQSQKVRTTDGTTAISATGNLDGSTLAELLAALPTTGTYELCCHPGYNDADLDAITTRLRAHRDTEREALLAEVPGALAQPDAPALITYADL